MSGKTILNDKNMDMETENQTLLWTVHLNVKADVSNKLVCTNHRGKLRTMYISDRNTKTKLLMSEIFQYVLSITKWSDVQKSCFQLAKMQKMNTSKHIRH